MGECERLFCDTLRAVFSGEGIQRADSLVMGVHSSNDDKWNESCELDNECAIEDDYGVDSPMQHGVESSICDFIEMWDYVGGIRFRGFVADKDGAGKAMFVFFDEAVITGDLKAGLMALLELCALPYFSCDRLVVCIDRDVDQLARDNLTKDLGWIGFGLTTLAEFADADETSDKWIFMDMET